MEGKITSSTGNMTLNIQEFQELRWMQNYIFNWNVYSSKKHMKYSYIIEPAKMSVLGNNCPIGLEKVS